MLDTTTLSKFTDQLGAAGADITLLMESSLDKASGKIEALAKEMVPVVTGNLRDSIETEVVDLTLVLSADTPYADVVQEKDPFLFVETDDGIEAIEDCFAQSVFEAVKEAAK